MATICSRCAKCCTVPKGLGITLEDIERWKTENRTDILSQINKLGFFGDSGCPFLSGVDCLIYKTRPTVCSRFPHWSDLEWAKQIGCRKV